MWQNAITQKDDPIFCLPAEEGDSYPMKLKEKQIDREKQGKHYYVDKTQQGGCCDMIVGPESVSFNHLLVFAFQVTPNFDIHFWSTTTHPPTLNCSECLP